MSWRKKNGIGIVIPDHCLKCHFLKDEDWCKKYSTFYFSKYCVNFISKTVMNFLIQINYILHTLRKIAKDGIIRS